MSRYYGEKECPSDPHDAYREGRRERWDNNPYEHGKHGDYECRRAYEEFERGQESAQRERREEEEAVEQAAQRRDFERRQYARAEQEERERMEYAEMEAEQTRYAEQDIRDAEEAQPSPTAAVEQGSDK